MISQLIWFWTVFLEVARWGDRGLGSVTGFSWCAVDVPVKIWASKTSPEMAWNLMSKPDRLWSSSVKLTGGRACSIKVMWTLSVDLWKQNLWLDNQNVLFCVWIYVHALSYRPHLAAVMFPDLLFSSSTPLFNFLVLFTFLLHNPQVIRVSSTTSCSTW